MSASNDWARPWNLSIFLSHSVPAHRNCGNVLAVPVHGRRGHEPAGAAPDRPRLGDCGGRPFNGWTSAMRSWRVRRIIGMRSPARPSVGIARDLLPSNGERRAHGLVDAQHFEHSCWGCSAVTSWRSIPTSTCAPADSASNPAVVLGAYARNSQLHNVSPRLHPRDSDGVGVVDT